MNKQVNEWTWVREEVLSRVLGVTVLGALFGAAFGRQALAMAFALATVITLVVLAVVLVLEYRADQQRYEE